MKKYLLGIFAVLLAVSLNSFTTAKKVNVETPYYWYHVVGNVTNGAAISVEAGKVTKTQALMDNYTDCPDSGADICLFGSDVDNLPNSSSIGTPATDQRVLYDE